MSLLDRLYQASYKGVSFLVANSSISFGQKTVKHEYPNSNRSEIEFLGLSEDEFNLEIYIHSADSDYIEKRNALKQALSSEGLGLLVHPYEGTITCGVVDRPTLVENDQTLGVAKFTVTFKKASIALFPTQAIQNASLIRNLLSTSISDLSTFINAQYSLSGLYPESFNNNITKLTTLSNLIKQSMNLVSLDSTSSSKLKKASDSFEDNIVTSANDAETLDEKLQETFDALDQSATNTLDNIIIYQSFFSYGQTDTVIIPITDEQKEVLRNNQAINQYVQIMSLALSYNVISTVDFNDDVQMNYYESLLETQYSLIVDDLIGSARYDLQQMRNQARIYFDNQDVRYVTDTVVQKNPLTKLAYLHYGNLDNFNRLYELNNKKDPTLYEGSVRMLTNE